MPILELNTEIEYTDNITKLSFRARPFWVAKDASYAIAIPEYERAVGTRRWHPFDHCSRKRLAGLFNFGPVSDTELSSFVIPEAPPFFFHRLNASVTRVKFGHPTSYGQSGSYFYYPRREGQVRMAAHTLLHNPEAVANLPLEYKERWDRALPLCRGKE